MCSLHSLSRLSYDSIMAEGLTCRHPFATNITAVNAWSTSTWEYAILHTLCWEPGLTVHSPILSATVWQLSATCLEIVSSALSTAAYRTCTNCTPTLHLCIEYHQPCIPIGTYRSRPCSSVCAGLGYGHSFRSDYIAVDSFWIPQWL